MKKRLLYILLFLFSSSVINSFAQNFMGGEITWQCLNNGNYRFSLILYRECSSTVFNNTEVLTVTNDPLVTSITMTLVSQTDLSPTCNSAYPNIVCYPAPSIPNTGAVEEWNYTSDAIYPTGITLVGIPPPQGWIFTYSECCRNTGSNLTNATSLGWQLHAVMYPYNNQNENPCFDNSPTFAERPATIMCTDYPFTFNYNAWDKDLDSLAYDWAVPLDSGGTSLAPDYVAGYSYTNPLPGTLFNANNVPATINLYTGEIAFTSYTQGAFITVTKVTSYKCGIKVSEVFREMQIVLTSCANDTAPAVTPPFPNGLGNYVNYIDTVWAGTLVTFMISASDSGLLPNGNQQTLTLTASGSEFGTNFTDSTAGCPYPPCATLNPAPPPLPSGLSAQYGVQTNFRWQTSCNDIASITGCNSIYSTFNFVFKVQDDYCPVPGVSIKTATIVVKRPPYLPPPELRCASVDASGDVTLSWKAVHDTANSFNSYHIYTSISPSGPFTDIDSIFNINITNYTQTGAGANTQTIYYYIKTRSSCGNTHYSAPSDTLKTILMSVVNTGGGAAQLSWNALHNPNLPTSLGWYRIYREFPPGVWTLIDSTQSLTYLDSITVCHSQINYIVAIDDALPCTSNSSIAGALFQDITAPPTPVIDSVSVDSLTSHSMIGWAQSTSGDTQGYIVYENIAGVWIPIDTVYGIGTNQYINVHPSNANPDSASLSYCIAAFDSCHNTSPLSISHSTIFLKSTPDICGGSVALNWTPYVNMHPGLMGYRVYVKTNNGPYTLLNINPPTNQSYTHTPVLQGSIYIYVVQAFDSSGTVTSTSNTDTVKAYAPLQPQYAYLRHVTVVNSDYVEVKALMDASAYVSKCKIMRAESALGTYSKIGTVVPPPFSASVTYNDNTALVNQQSYYYKVIVDDSCGNDILTTNIGKTIFLQTSPQFDMKNDLAWDAYEDWLGGVSSYVILRKVDDVPDLNPLTTVNSSTFTHTDDVSAFTQTTGKFSYIVEALEGPGNPYHIADSSFSNESVAMQTPRFYVPTAFVPKGINNIFIPVSVFVNADDYQFSVYNRWGGMVFNTNDTKTGWDGSFKGVQAPEGVYAYCIKYRNNQNQIIQRTGTVVLIR